MTLCTLSHPALSLYFFHKFFPPLIHFFAPDCLHGLLSWLFRLSNSVLKMFSLFFGTVHYRSNWIFVRYWAHINTISSRFVVHCFVGKRICFQQCTGLLAPVTASATRLDDTACGFYPQVQRKWGWYQKIIEIGSFLTELVENKKRDSFMDHTVCHD